MTNEECVPRHEEVRGAMRSAWACVDSALVMGDGRATPEYRKAWKKLYRTALEVERGESEVGR